jgi:hypothetical protein
MVRCVPFALALPDTADVAALLPLIRSPRDVNELVSVNLLSSPNVSSTWDEALDDLADGSGLTDRGEILRDGIWRLS